LGFTSHPRGFGHKRRDRDGCLAGPAHPGIISFGPAPECRQAGRDSRGVPVGVHIPPPRFWAQAEGQGRMFGGPGPSQGYLFRTGARVPTSWSGFPRGSGWGSRVVPAASGSGTDPGARGPPSVPPDGPAEAPLPSEATHRAATSTKVGRRGSLTAAIPRRRKIIPPPARHTASPAM